MNIIETANISPVRFTLENAKVRRPDFLYPVEEFAKAGFDLKAELSRRGRLINKFGVEKGNRIWVTGVTDEVVEHAFEYGLGDTVRTPPSYELVDGRLYSLVFDDFAENITNGEERGGAVLHGLKKVQQQLDTAIQGSFVIWSSPDGPLGFNNLEYNYSWTHVFWKEGAKVQYVSIRTDFTLHEHAQFLNNFLGFTHEFDIRKFKVESMENIQEILETPVVADIGGLPIIGKMMAEVRPFSNTIYQDKQSGVRHTFEEVINSLSDIDGKKQREEQLTRPIITAFEDKLKDENLTDEGRLQIMGQYLLALHYIINHSKESIKGDAPISSRDVYYSVHSIPADAYHYQHIKKMQEIGGCAGGIKQNTSTFTSHLSEANPLSPDHKGKLWKGNCPVCNKSVEIYPNEYCPGCGTQYICTEE